MLLLNFYNTLLTSLPTSELDPVSNPFSTLQAELPLSKGNITCLKSSVAFTALKIKSSFLNVTYRALGQVSLLPHPAGLGPWRGASCPTNSHFPQSLFFTALKPAAYTSFCPNGSPTPGFKNSSTSFNSWERISLTLWLGLLYALWVLKLCLYVFMKHYVAVTKSIIK